MSERAPVAIHRRSLRARLRYHVLTIVVVAAYGFVLAPIALMVVYSFNATGITSSGVPKVSFRWEGFTAEWYRRWNDVPDLIGAFANSLLIAVLTAVIATAIGTLLALALSRYSLPGSGAVSGILFLSIAAPELVLGASLLSVLVLAGIELGFATILMAHVTFCIAFVTVTVRARITDSWRQYEEAAADLYANGWTTFRTVTIRLLLPAISAGTLLAFALSIDDFVITSFVAGQTVTFPLWVYGSVKVGMPPQVFVLGTVIFALGLVVALPFALIRRRSSTRSR
jgi:spermidine/putrescine transport system permease protein